MSSMIGVVLILVNITLRLAVKLITLMVHKPLENLIMVVQSLLDMNLVTGPKNTLCISTAVEKSPDARMNECHGTPAQKINNKMCELMLYRKKDINVLKLVQCPSKP